jgi:hypothetical protein
MRQVVRNGGVTDLDLDERLRVGGGLVTDAYLVVRGPGPAAAQGRDQAPNVALVVWPAYSSAGVFAAPDCACRSRSRC